MVAFGEVGLSGEVRSVSMIENRVAEASKLGFTTCIIPKAYENRLKSMKGMKIIGVRSVQDAMQIM